MDANSPPTPEPTQQRGASSGVRRTHQKSRLGCKTCKSRKIKCDERKPACGNCIRHHVECDFVASSAAAAAEALASSSSGSGSSGSGIRELNPDHLELLHNYATSTYATLSESPVVRDFYRITAVQMGLECDYVMRALLAVSSLQLAYYRPHRREHYHSEAAHHHQIASRIAGNLIRELNASNVENLFLFSTLTIFYAFASPRRDEQRLLVGETGIPSWFFLHQGTRALSELARARADGPLAPLFRHGADRWAAREGEGGRQQQQQQQEEETASSSSSSPAHQHLDRLRALIERDERDAGLRSTYVNAIAELRKSFLSMERGRAHDEYEVTDVFVWVFQVGDDFVPLLREPPTQSAAAILAFFCVLLRGLRSQWWLHGWADYLMARSYALLDAEHRLWIRWPMEEIGYVP
ncbi:hypothetical protein F4802DRAFT_327055 [Xylaria palmicola]|nr:hypothetical protein F4802DRAFT_327055 [Xylaria palmicola]